MRIGIIITGDYGWAGGVYYSLNIIKLLHAISLSKKMTVIAIVNSFTPLEIIADLPKENIEISCLDKKTIFYRLYHKMIGDRFVADINALNLDVLYPLLFWNKSHNKLNCKALYWIYDFQHKFFPELFSPEEIKKRDQTFENISRHSSNVVFSSYDSKHHFNKFYPANKAQQHVYNFVSLLSKNAAVQKTPVIIPENYFIVCNQFWPHKNHGVVINAVEHFVKEKMYIHIVFTGKNNDTRNKEYVDKLKKIIVEKHLETHITFTGFISREAQVALIVKAKAVIQPSYFEGWSTVVEDAKALNKFMIVSDIAVNREQVNNNVLFFSPSDDQQLKTCIEDFNCQKINPIVLNYDENISESKNKLIKLFDI